jgi:hypothetical protein|tara:strand:- start:18476 stop:18736 length:261 start_codon:yes stop_codon:yes gene_type:complete
MTSKITFFNTKKEKHEFSVVTACVMLETFNVMATNEVEAEALVLLGEYKPNHVEYKDEEIVSVCKLERVELKCPDKTEPRPEETND